MYVLKYGKIQARTLCRVSITVLPQFGLLLGDDGYSPNARRRQRCEQGSV
jgi:hypothetical protein